MFEATATELGALYATGAVTPVQALEAILAQIEAVNGRLNAVVTLDLQGARRAAEESGSRWRTAKQLGPLDGVPVTVKDNLFVAGVRTTWGSLIFSDHVAPCDDVPIARLRSAGAVILGKTNTPELALSGHTDNRVFGPTGHPLDFELSPGGSSGGAAAAVGAGIGPIAIATDAGGSIRRPASHVGVAGLKPGIGRVPRRYGFPLLAHDLQVIGAIARSVSDLRLAFAAIATPPASEPPRLNRLRIGAFADFSGMVVEPAIKVAFEQACEGLRSLGHNVEEIEPLWDPEEASRLLGALASVGVARTLAGVGNWRGRVTDAIAELAKAGAQRSAVDYVRDLDALAEFRWRMADAMDLFDAIATPATASFAWPKSATYPRTIAGRPVGPRASAVFSTAVNLAGLPAVVVPAPIASEELPAGLQLIGRLMAEESLLDLAQAFEHVCPWPRQMASELG